MRHVVMALAASLCSWAAQAQMVEVDTADVQAMACLQKNGTPLRYPSRDEKMRLPGHLRLSLKFTAPDRAPEFEVLFRAASDAMLEEVRWYVRDYRLPCLPDGAKPVRMVQEFVFTPRETDPITWTPARVVQDATEDGDSSKSPSIMSCARTPKKPIDLGGGHDFGNAFVDMRFTAPDAPPEVTMRYASLTPKQVQTVEAYVREYRLPCMEPGSKARLARQHFHFHPYGKSARLFNDAVSLRSFLANVKGIQNLHASFDFTTMSCPFQVAWTLGKPALDNEVGQVGKPDLNRTEFLAWMAGLEMRTQGQEFEQLVGHTLIVNVSCGTLNL
jgi:hypothetical protein